MLDITYLLSVERSFSTPEERLARAVVLDWFLTLRTLVNKKTLTVEERTVWRREINWVYTDNARFWVEEVLDGSIEALRLIAEDFKRLRKGEKPRYFRELQNIIKRKRMLERNRISGKDRRSRAAIRV